MQIDQITAFLKIADTDNCNFTAAANALGKSQPTLSRLMQDLQKVIGKDVLLFETKGRRKVLSPYGVKLRELLRPIMRSWDEVPKRLRQEADSREPVPVSLGTGMTAARYLIPDTVRKFQRANKFVDLSLRVELFSETLKGLRSGELDFGLRSSDTIPHDMNFWITYSFEHKLIVPKPHPLAALDNPSIEEISRHPFITPSTRTRGWSAIRDYFSKQGLDCHPAITVGGWDLVKLYVGMGLGISIVPEFCIQSADKAKLKVLQSPEGYGRGDYGILTPKERFLSRSALALIKMLAPGFRKNVTRMRGAATPG